MSSAGTVAKKSLDIGRVFQDGVLVVVRNLATFGPMSLVLCGCPSLLFGLGLLLAQRNPTYYAVPVVGWLLQLVGGSILHAMLAYKLALALDGREASLRQSVRVGRQRWLPLLGLALLQNVLILTGFVLLIAPGVLLLLRWSVASSAFILENRGVRDSWRRSVQLTQGRRWAIFLLLAICLVLYVISYLIAVALSGHDSAGSPSLYYLVWRPLLSALDSLVMVAIFTALFVRLRAEKESNTPEALAEVFA